jgi:negative regulator of sigma-B (phosphoserine phosphatase)
MSGGTSEPRIERHREVVTWAVAEAPFPNESQSGDRYVVLPSADGVLIAAIDGAGHGVEAAAAAKVAVATLEAHAFESPIGLLVRCHEELKGSRGVVMTIAFIHLGERTLTWAGVGNVEAVLFHGIGKYATSADRALLRSGVIGYRLPPVRAEVLPLKSFDTLVIVTDGIKPNFDDGLVLADDLQVIADGILARHHNAADDALVLVARYVGGEGERPPA